jgi:hypothetical protein
MKSSRALHPLYWSPILYPGPPQHLPDRPRHRAILVSARCIYSRHPQAAHRFQPTAHEDEMSDSSYDVGQSLCAESVDLIVELLTSSDLGRIHRSSPVQRDGFDMGELLAVV